MDKIEIKKDSKIVSVLAAEARKERLDSEVRKNAHDVIAALSANPTPDNRYQIGQLVAFAVNEVATPQMNWLESVADVKNVGFGEKAAFKTKLEGIRAYIQAKGSTTARSKVANKTFSMDTLAVSVRPIINVVEMRTNQANMGDLVNEAAVQMNLTKLGYIYKVLMEGAKTWAAPYYGTGSGIVKATLDPMIHHWMRISGGGAPSIMGDIDMISKVGDLTGFKASTDKQQFANELILEQNKIGFVGVYGGANVVNMLNPYLPGSDETILGRKQLFILPGGLDASMRPLKVVNEGGVTSMEQTNIDDGSFEVRLDQYFNAAIVYGDRPYMSVYEES